MDAVCCNALMPQLSDPADRLVPQAGVSVALWLYGRGGTAPARAQHLDSRYVDIRRYLQLSTHRGRGHEEAGGGGGGPEHG